MAILFQMNSLKKLSLLLFLLLNCFFLFSQQNNFKSYSIKEGLPQSSVPCILQDKRGYLWLGTNGGGAARFDGKNFKVYNKKNGLVGNVVRSLFEDSKGNLWFGTDEGISIYDGSNFFSINQNDSLKGSTVLCFAENKDGKVFAGTDNAGINIIESGGNKKVKISNYPTGDENNFPVFDILIDNEKVLLGTFYGGILLLSEEKDSFKVSKFGESMEFPSDRILSLAKDDEGNIWVGTSDAGVFKIDSENKITSYQPKDGFAGISVWDILIAKDKTLWFATGGHGVIHFTKNKFLAYTTEEGLPHNQVFCAFRDAEGNIFFGTNGSGLCRLIGEHFSHFTKNEGLSSDNIQGISQDNSGAMWLATNGGGAIKMIFSEEKFSIQKFTTQNNFLSDNLSAIARGNNKNKNLWFGTVKDGIVKYDPDKIGAGGKKFYNYTESDGLQENRVSSIMVDKKGIVWCGTANGISRFDGVKFLNASMEKMKMSDEGVKTIVEDNEGNIWFGTAGGLAKYGGDGSITTYDEVEGLAEKDVNAIAVDAVGNIWIGTKGGGIFLFDVTDKDSMPIRFVANDSLLSSNSINAITFTGEEETKLAALSTGGFDTLIIKHLLIGTNKGIDKLLVINNSIENVRSYDASDGFSGVEVNDNAFFRDKEDNIWIGTIQGLTKYSPAKENILSLPPQIHITNLQLDYKDVNWTARKFQTSSWFNLPLNLKLPYDENNLTFHFTAISYSNPDKISYTTFLEGQDKNWTPLSSENKITYSALNPGTYTFKVKATNAEGTWSDEATYTLFIILPPWYQTTTFYVSCAVFLIIAIIIFIKYRERKLIEEKKVLEQKVKERTAEVVKQKEEIEQQKEVIEEKNKDITDSINYAKKIQEAILPKEEERKNLLENSFVLFKPKDIVSGDFYWMHERDGKILFMAADCTGHGVPGAFMSMIGSSLLNQIVGEKKIFMPDQILNQLRIEIMKALKQTGAEGESKDGMDASLCLYDKINRKLYFSGANNSMYLVRKNKDNNNDDDKDLKVALENESFRLYEIKPDKQPIGFYLEQTPFTIHELYIRQEDTVYVFSDGYEDQFGGPKGKKFMSKKFKEFLLTIQNKTINEQFSLVDETIENWKNYDGKKYEQNDDILVIGVKF